MPTPSRLPPGNRLLAALPRPELERLRLAFKHVHLAKGQTLYHAGDAINYVYFPASGMCSLLAATEGGALLEVGIVGYDGFVGLPAILHTNIMPYHVIVQLATNAYRISAVALRAEFDRCGQLQVLLLRYTNTLLAQISQTAVCNRFHSTEKRLGRWLLISLDVVGSDTIPLTQEFLSYMLGVPRTGVTLAAGNLQRRGLISYSRGRIKVLNQEKLEQAACECHRVVRAETTRILAA